MTDTDKAAIRYAHAHGHIPRQDHRGMLLAALDDAERERDEWMIAAENKRIERAALVDTLITIKLLAEGKVPVPVEPFALEGVRDSDEGAALRAVVALLCERDELRAMLAEAEATRDNYRAGLDAIRRSGDPKGACLPECPSWSEDYRINDCDCGYEASNDNSSAFAADVLDGLEVRAAPRAANAALGGGR